MAELALAPDSQARLATALGLTTAMIAVSRADIMDLFVAYEVTVAELQTARATIQARGARIQQLEDDLALARNTAPAAEH